MKKLIISCAMLFAVATVGTMYAQEGGDKKCCKTEKKCCDKKEKSCCKKEASKKECNKK